MSTWLIANMNAEHDQDDPAAGADELSHAAQGTDVVLDVLEHVVGDRRAVLTVGIGGRQQHLPHVDVGVVGEALLEQHQPVRVRLGRGEAGHPLRPLERIVAQTTPDLDRVVAQVRERELHEPTTVVHGRGEAFEHFGLDPLVSSDVCHK
nr:hypothetical protein GCM10020092_004130 [Actinoplanes digitatis]